MPDTLLESVIKTPDNLAKLWIAGFSFAFIVGSSLTVTAMNLKSVAEKQDRFATGQVALQIQDTILAAKDAELDANQKKSDAVIGERLASINRNLDAIMRKLE